jgi:hypothetical protein
VLNRISDGLVPIVSAFKAARIAAFIYPRQIRLLISLLKLTEDSSRKGVIFLSNAQIEKTGLVEECVSGDEERNSGMPTQNLKRDPVEDLEGILTEHLNHQGNVVRIHRTESFRCVKNARNQ